MSRFKVGDRVVCVDPGMRLTLVKGETYEVTAISGGDIRGRSVCVNGINDDWWWADRFELVSPPQPAESPDDWVTQDVVRARPGIDERAYRYDTTPEAGLQWDRAGAMKWDPMPMHGERGNGLTVHLRCRRRDYPQQPVEVHSVGPYVARSEYERVCLERDDALTQAVRIRDEAARLAAERDQLESDQKVLLSDLKATEQTVIHLNKRVFANAANGWPLVPVDPLCIPDGHRVVEVTKNTQGKLVASLDGLPRKFINNEKYARLVVEPIPTPTPDPLPRPEFPAWIRAGWWVAMDADKEWFAYDIKPLPDEADSDWYVRCNFTYVSNPTESMQSIPADRWREAKWQVE